MSELEDLKRQVAELRGEVEALRNLSHSVLSAHQRDIEIIQIFLSLFNSRPWVPFTRDFGLWSQDQEARLDELQRKREEELNARLDEFRRSFHYTVDDGNGGRKIVFPWRDK